MDLCQAVFCAFDRKSRFGTIKAASVTLPQPSQREFGRPDRRACSDFCRTNCSRSATSCSLLNPTSLFGPSLPAKRLRLIGVSDSYLRQLSSDGVGPTPEQSSTGRRSYTLGQINELRRYLANAASEGGRRVPAAAAGGERMQTIACTNFKGGSAKTTTTLYLAQFLALEGYRVLALDLDPQASLTSMFGIQPEFDLRRGRDALRRHSLRRCSVGRWPRSSGRTYFDGIDLVPGNLELMEFEHETPRASDGR